MVSYKFVDNNVILENFNNFSLSQTLDCGQAFRWRQIDQNVWEGIAFGKYLKISQNDNTFCFYNTSVEDFENIWIPYFDIKRDYGEIIKNIDSTGLLYEAATYGCGIRILRQDSWEALCSFIISQNNNIPRIKGIIERLCENFGEKHSFGYTFPTAQKIAELTLEDLAVLRSGFRAKYILDAAKRVSDGTINLEDISLLSTEQARCELTKIYGVGTKVADCTLLYGMGHINAFPKDVWIKRAVPVFFGDSFDESKLQNAGVIQQYMFFQLCYPLLCLLQQNSFQFFWLPSRQSPLHQKCHQ